MMKPMFGMFAVFCAVALAAGPAGSEETTTPQTGAGQTQTETAQPAPTTPPPSEVAPAAPAAEPAPTTPPPAMEAGSPAAATDVLASIRATGKKVNPKADQNATTALDAASSDLEKIVATDGDRKIADRLAAEFGTTADALLAEKSDVKASWGQLVIAHSLAANATTPVTVKQLFDLRGEGMSWGQIANGMGLHLGQVVRATKEEVRVAKGLAKPDGKVAVVTGPGSKADAAKAEQAAMKAAAKADKEAKAQAAKADAAKAEAVEEAAKVEAAKADAPKAEAAKEKAEKETTPATPGDGASSGKGGGNH